MCRPISHRLHILGHSFGVGSGNASTGPGAGSASGRSFTMRAAAAAAVRRCISAKATACEIPPAVFSLSKSARTSPLAHISYLWGTPCAPQGLPSGGEPSAHQCLYSNRESDRCTLLCSACIRLISSERYSHLNPSLHAYVCFCLVWRYVGSFSRVLAFIRVRLLKACSISTPRRPPLWPGVALFNVIASAASLHVSYAHAIHLITDDRSRPPGMDNRQPWLDTSSIWKINTLSTYRFKSYLSSRLA
jgi:hypothetical protein